MRATALLARVPKPTDEQIDTDMQANICRCGTYTRIRKAIHNAADKIAKAGRCVMSTNERSTRIRIFRSSSKSSSSSASRSRRR